MPGHSQAAPGEGATLRLDETAAFLRDYRPAERPPPGLTSQGNLSLTSGLLELSREECEKEKGRRSGPNPLVRLPLPPPPLPRAARTRLPQRTPFTVPHGARHPLCSSDRGRTVCLRAPPARRQTVSCLGPGRPVPVGGRGLSWRRRYPRPVYQTADNCSLSCNASVAAPKPGLDSLQTTSYGSEVLPPREPSPLGLRRSRTPAPPSGVRDRRLESPPATVRPSNLGLARPPPRCAASPRPYPCAPSWPNGRGSDVPASAGLRPTYPCCASCVSSARHG